MSSVVIPDRGPTPHFRGREEIINTFTNYLKHYLSEKGGTTFLIQGAPGAGKTALLDKLRLAAEDQKWKTAEIGPAALWDVKSLRESIPDRNILKRLSGKVNAGLPEGGSIEISMKDSVETIKKVLRSGKKPLLLILDEAQHLGIEGVVPNEMRGVVTGVLDEIHNGKLGRPVVLLAAGLGTTESAFDSLGISRFVGDCTVGLGPLDRESERAAIRDWIVKEGGTNGNTDQWIEAIAKETHGWPQHIISYVKPAVGYLKSNNHLMTDAGLRIVLEKGAESRLRYYRQRAHDIDWEQRQSLARSLGHLPIGETTTRTSILTILNEEYPPEVADNLFKRALEQGILDKHEDGRYGVPIPSMQTWLIEEYGRKQVDMPKIEDEVSKVRRELPKQEKEASKWSRER